MHPFAPGNHLAFFVILPFCLAFLALLQNMGTDQEATRFPLIVKLSEWIVPLADLLLRMDGLWFRKLGDRSSPKNR
jgi:Sec-independent protein secretion pathway component TatC